MRYEYDSIAGIVFDFRKLKIALLEQAKQFGAEIKLGTEVVGIKHVTTYSEIETVDGLKYQCKIAIDASGPARVFGRHLKYNKPKLAPTVGIEVICEVVDFPADQDKTLDFYMGDYYSPHGYAWIFPMGGNKFKVGICVYQMASIKPPIDLNLLLDNFIKNFKWLDNRKHVETHGGSAYVEGKINKMVYGNVILVGDSADTINPFGAEGIRHAFQSAKFASELIVEVINGYKPLTILAEYESRWSKIARTKWFISRIVSIIIYHHLNDFGFKMLMRSLQRLSPKEAMEVVFGFKFINFIKAFFRIRNKQPEIIN